MSLSGVSDPTGVAASGASVTPVDSAAAAVDGPLAARTTEEPPTAPQDESHTDKTTAGDNEQPEATSMSRLDKRKLKKKRKQIERGMEGSESDYLQIYGAGVTSSLELKLADFFVNDRSSLKSRDLQQLIGWTIGEDVSPKWVFVKNKPLIKQVVLLVVDGMTSASLRENEEGSAKTHGRRRKKAPDFRSAFSSFTHPQPQPVPLYTSHSAFNRSSVLADYLSCPIVRDKEKEKAEKRKRQRLENGGVATVTSVVESPEELLEPHPLKHLKQCIISEDEMVTHNYPTPAMSDVTEYRRTCNRHNCTLRAPVAPPSPSEAASAIDVVELNPEWVAFPCVHAVGQAVSESSSSPTNESVVSPTSDSASPLAAAASPSPPAASPADPHADDEDDVDDVPKLFAVDCEMCYTSVGLELTRATLLDECGTVLLDSFVKPVRPIVDYNTKYSGITADMLADVRTTIDDVRVSMARFIGARDILVGHSLENDLRALRLAHRNCLDSALLYSHPRGPPFKHALRHLALKHLSRTIQAGSGGHDSREDALAALDLVRMKLAAGRSFGEPQAERESLARVLARSNKRCTLVGPPLDVQDVITDEPLYSAVMKPAEEVAAAVARECANKTTHLVIATLPLLRTKHAAQKKTTATTTIDGTTPPAPAASAESPPPSPLSAGLPLLHDALETILHAARPNTMVLVASGQGLGAAQPGAENNKQGILWMKMVGHEQTPAAQAK